MIRPARPTDRQENTNFVGPLENGHEHGVHDAKNTDEQREQRRAPTHRPNESKSFVVTEVFAHRDGANLRDPLLNLSGQLLELFFGSRRCDANIDGVDLVGRTENSLQERK